MRKFIALLPAYTLRNPPARTENFIGFRLGAFLADAPSSEKVEGTLPLDRKKQSVAPV